MNFAFTCLLAGVVTAGWENINLERHELEPSEIVWKADLTRPSDFEFERRQGAEGSVSFSNGTVSIRKDNAAGYLLLRAKPFLIATNRMLRVMADAHTEDAVPEYSHAFVRAHGKQEFLGMQDDGYRADAHGGWALMTGLINMPQGMFYRKYYHARSEDGTFAPVIVVAGAPSTSMWKNWMVEDHAASKVKWRKLQEETARQRIQPTPLSPEEFDRRLAADDDHTARIVRKGDHTVFTIDGKAVPPVVYRGIFRERDLSDIGASELLRVNGVRVVIPSHYMIGPYGKFCWTRKGFDAKKAVDDLYDQMRAADDALFMIGFCCCAYPEFLEDHPGEQWETPDGRQMYGDHLRADEHGSHPPGTWPWASFASPSWREAVKANIRAYVAELKRRGLSKRVIGVHVFGYNDLQMSMYTVDPSPCARAEYAEYLKEPDIPSTNYWHFCYQLPQRRLEEFSREFKLAMGKDVVAIRWCDAPFVVSHDLDAFCRSKWTDVLVPQPSYNERGPGIATTIYAPYTSIARSGKMLWSELDHRTWRVLCSSSVVDHKHNCPAEDIQSWRSSFRKLAGQMIAERAGYWFFDMGHGWYTDNEIAEDVGAAMKTMRTLLERKPSNWRKEVALIVDNTGYLGWDGGVRRYPSFTYFLSQKQMRLMANASVPYDVLLADDAMRHPESLDGKKLVVFMLWRKFDQKRIDFVRRMSTSGRTLVFLAESGVCGGAKEATGFNVAYTCDKNQGFTVLPQDGMRESTVGFADIEMVRDPYFGQYRDQPALRPPEFDRRTVIVEDDPEMRVLGRYADGGGAAIAVRIDGGCRKVYIAVPGGMSPGYFNRLARKAGAYVPIGRSQQLQVNMNGDFISIHALVTGHVDFKLPFPAKVINVASGREEVVTDDVLPLDLTAGETCWFLLERR